MSESIKDKVKDAGQAVADKAKEAGAAVKAGAEKAADWVKEKAHAVGHHAEEATREGMRSCNVPKGTTDIREHMDVIGSCGNKLGVVDHVAGSTLKLTKNDSPDGQHHYIPIGWVERVDEHVHLTKNCGEARKEWQTEPAKI
jgi:hypothetical protein